MINDFWLCVVGIFVISHHTSIYTVEWLQALQITLDMDLLMHSNVYQCITERSLVASLYGLAAAVLSTVNLCRERYCKTWHWHGAPSHSGHSSHTSSEEGSHDSRCDKAHKLFTLLPSDRWCRSEFLYLCSLTT